MAVNDKKNIQFVIFDCDNILVNTDIILVSLMLDILEEYGINLTPDKAIEKFTGNSIHECINTLKKLTECDFYSNFEDEVSKMMEHEIFHSLEALNSVTDFLQALPCPYILITYEDALSIKKKLLLSDLLSYFSSENIIFTHPGLYSNMVLNMIASYDIKPQHTLVIKDRPYDLAEIIEKGVTVASPDNFPADRKPDPKECFRYEEITDLLKNYRFS